MLWPKKSCFLKVPTQHNYALNKVSCKLVPAKNLKFFGESNCRIKMQGRWAQCALSKNIQTSRWLSKEPEIAWGARYKGTFFRYFQAQGSPREEILAGTGNCVCRSCKQCKVLRFVAKLEIYGPKNENFVMEGATRTKEIWKLCGAATTAAEEIDRVQVKLKSKSEFSKEVRNITSLTNEALDAARSNGTSISVKLIKFSKLQGSVTKKLKLRCDNMSVSSNNYEVNCSVKKAKKAVLSVILPHFYTRAALSVLGAERDKFETRCDTMALMNSCICSFAKLARVLRKNSINLDSEL